MMKVNRVSPIKSRNKIERLKAFLKSKRKYRELLLFVIGINTPLHISEILPMKWDLFLTDSERIKEVNTQIVLTQESTYKTRFFILNRSIYEALKLHYEHYPYISRDDYVFVSQKTKNGKNLPITRQYVWTLLNKYARMVGIKEKIGAHSLRKTFGYHLYKKGVPISHIRTLLNQPNISRTLRYIDVSPQEYDERSRIRLMLNL